MQYLLGFIVISVLFSCSAAAETQCHQVSKIDCDNNYTPVGDERVCCSDLTAYPNLCHFAQKKCKDPSLTILNSGPCNLSTPGPLVNLTSASTPPMNATTQETVTHDATTAEMPAGNTDDVIRNVFCSNAASITCPDELDPVCGTDGKFYTNDCAFAKAKCEDAHLQLQDLALCKVAHRHRRQLAFV